MVADDRPGERGRLGRDEQVGGHGIAGVPAIAAEDEREVLAEGVLRLRTEAEQPAADRGAAVIGAGDPEQCHALPRRELAGGGAGNDRVGRLGCAAWRGPSTAGP